MISVGAHEHVQQQWHVFSFFSRVNRLYWVCIVCFGILVCLIFHEDIA